MDTAFVSGYLAGAIAIGYGVWVAWRLWDRTPTDWQDHVDALRCPGCGEFKDIGEHGPNQGFGGCV